MTMAHDSAPGSASLDDQTIEAVRAALRKYISAPASAREPAPRPGEDSIPRFAPAAHPASSGDELHAALHLMAAEARAKSVLPETLLVVLKDIWYSLPGVSAKREQSEQVRLLQRVVTMCIKEYYAD
jgi:hypothetical protein